MSNSRIASKESSKEAEKRGGEPRNTEGSGKEVLKGDNERFTSEIVESMHERKLRMSQVAAGGFVVLPGGYGTFEEMMEMITWNQLGIHMKPVIVLNINNIFTPLRTLLQNAVEAGFIQPQNLALVQILDLPGGAQANSDERQADAWGPATITALKEWSVSDDAGYGLKWDQPGNSSAEMRAKENAAESQKEETFSLFTTMRFTSVDVNRPTLPVTKEQIPLLGLHFHRLRKAFRFFAERDGPHVWAQCPSDDCMWQALSEALTRREEQQQGDWRIRLLISRAGKIEVQIVAAPANAGPFQPLPARERGHVVRPLILDPETSPRRGETPQSRDLRLFKTTKRGIYDDASKRAGTKKIFQVSDLHSESARPDLDHPEVLLHTSIHLLETATSNIAIEVPTASGTKWITPRLQDDDRPFLDGVMRQHLLATGVIEVGDLTVDAWHEAKRKGYRIIGFNGLRGVWEAEPA
ncbi:lysine decarboxylase-domain-containing protein [Kockovaella imperatae]|uniref:Lysine decarboxylase-domain-containing protein n=1 Tax=Kockovaella imperatae TaxID=4999 RepID=A0A1Y1UPT4_9TREE|nr:lysine decarboxylase-domain-containing protein [Kockovaella imperatae]ORX39982.1 lysine decarboxylase-domain-containing protein [Kockovaella imperatae]